MSVAENRVAIQKALVATPMRTIFFTYSTPDGKRQDRHVEPYEIKKIGEGKLQLVAYCLDREDTRRFDLDRMEAISEGEPFEPRFPQTRISVDL